MPEQTNGQDARTQGTSPETSAPSVVGPFNTRAPGDSANSPSGATVGAGVQPQEVACGPSDRTGASGARQPQFTDGGAQGSRTGVDGTARQGRGLTLRDIIEDAKEFSAQASTNTRFLAAGGLAVVWALADGKVAALRRPSMSLAVIGFVLALVADYLHYAFATKKLVAMIERNAGAGATHDSPVRLTRADVPAAAWFKWKTRCLVWAYLVLAWAFVMTVFPEAGGAVRRLAEFLTQ